MIYTPDNGNTWAVPPASIIVEGVQYGTYMLERNAQWATLVAGGVYREWYEAGDNYGLGYTARVIEPNPDPEDDIDVAARYLAGTDEERIAADRSQKSQAIDAQVPDGTARRLVEDPLFEGEIQSYSGGASERKSELEDTPDAEVGAFNTTIVPTPISGDGFVQAKMTVLIDIVDPWAGAPDAIYALRCALRIVTTGHDADGESARAHMYNEAGVDQGVIPFTQDADDPSVWWTQSQVGRYWASPDTGASMRLLWDSGQTAVAETKTLSGYGDRQYAIVRAGLPGS